MRPCSPAKVTDRATCNTQACTACGQGDELQRTASLSDPDAPRGINCSGGELLPSPCLLLCTALLMLCRCGRIVRRVAGRCPRLLGGS